MHKKVKVSKGLNIKLKGKAKEQLAQAPRSKMYAVRPTEFYGINPRLMVKPGDHVDVGDPIFYHKYNDRIKFTSPVSGTIEDVVRGERRKILKILIKADEQDRYKKFDIKDPKKASREEILEVLLESGLFPVFKQRPYDVIAKPEDEPKAIFISAYDSAPLGVNYDFILSDRLKDFQAGIDAVKKLTSGKVYLIVDNNSASKLENIEGIEIIKAEGPHPAGNPSVHIEKFEPIGKGDRIWVVNPAHIAQIGSLFNTGKYNPEKVVALAGSMVKDPKYYSVIPGADLTNFLNDKLKEGEARIISGNVLTGSNISEDTFLNFYDNEISVIPLGNKSRFLGWMPFLGENRKSFYNFSLLPGNKELDLDANLFGEERAFVMTEEFDSVIPMDIYPVHLLKAALLGDVEKMESLGILEVAPEDFALVDYISSSKLDAQYIIRKGLDIMQVEMES